MNAGRTIFAQLMDSVSPYDFPTCVDRSRGHYKVRSFSRWDQFLSLAFAKLTSRESLRDIHACLRVRHNWGVLCSSLPCPFISFQREEQLRAPPSPSGASPL